MIDLESKINKKISEVLNEEQKQVQAEFQSAEYAGYNDVTVTVEGNSIIASGKAVAFIEYGTGLQGKHPGSYGKGQGSNPKGWNYFGSIGNARNTEESKTVKGAIHTYGNPPLAAMFNASQRIREKL